MQTDTATQTIVGMSTRIAEPADDGQDLLGRVREGDARAFELLMRQHERLVLVVALRLLGNQEDARDAAQEVFLKLYRFGHAIEPGNPVKPWLYRVAVNVCNDMLRQRVSARRVFAVDESIEDWDGAEDGNVEGALLAAQQRQVLRLALGKLPNRERTALVLRDVEGLETEEVARMLGTSAVTVRAHVSRGRMRLRRIVERMMRRGRT
jgi:RNA polymerase sigma-70 factor (ECF subfamily)